MAYRGAPAHRGRAPAAAACGRGDLDASDAGTAEGEECFSERPSNSGEDASRFCLTGAWTPLYRQPRLLPTPLTEPPAGTAVTLLDTADALLASAARREGFEVP